MEFIKDFDIKETFADIYKINPIGILNIYEFMLPRKPSLFLNLENFLENLLKDNENKSLFQIGLKQLKEEETRQLKNKNTIYEIIYEYKYLFPTAKKHVYEKLTKVNKFSPGSLN